jgi:hypothetical protein
MSSSIHVLAAATDSSAAAAALSSFVSQWLFVFWGTTIADVIYGFSVLQCITYFTKHHNDHWSVIVLVGLLLIIGTISTILTTRNLTVHFVDHFLDPTFVIKSTTEQHVDDLITIITQFVSQMFFAVKIFQVRRTFLPVSVLIAALAISTTVIASIVGLALAGTPTLATYSANQVQTLFTAGLGLTAVNDCLIALALVLVLRGFNTNYCQTKNIVVRFTVLAVQRGALVTIVVLLWLAFFLANPTSFAWKPFRLTAPGLHIVTLIAFLNGRHYSLSHMAKYGHQLDSVGSRGLVDEKGGQTVSSRFSIV